MTLALENQGDPLNRAIRKKPSVKKPALLAQLLALAAGERSAFIWAEEPYAGFEAR